MSAIPRRELDELFAKYDFHPGIFDIYVEGAFDFDFINMFLKEISVTSISVFQIDDIDVPSKVVEEHGLHTGSNKDRVLTLARLLDIRYGQRSTNVTCLVDADCDRVLNIDYGMHHVSVTDYSCLESYLFSRPTLTRFLTFACSLSDQSPEEFSNLASVVLPAQFALRATARALELNHAVLGFQSGLIKKADIFSFDAEKYLASYISRYSIQQRRDEVGQKFRELMASAPQDVRHAMQGHDFVTLLFEYLWSRNALRLHDKSETAQKFGGRLVALACRATDLLVEPLFAKIAASASGASAMRP